jgi:hypothetical protein
LALLKINIGQGLNVLLGVTRKQRALAAIIQRDYLLNAVTGAIPTTTINTTGNNFVAFQFHYSSSSYLVKK